MNFNRRKFLDKIGKGALLSLATAKLFASETCNLLTTPDQPLGPFYPHTIPLDTNADLTWLAE